MTIRKELALLLGFQACLTIASGFILTTQVLPNSTSSEQIDSAELLDPTGQNQADTDPSPAPAPDCREPTTTELEVRLQLLYSRLSLERVAESIPVIWNVTGYLAGFGYRSHWDGPECSRRPSDLAERFPIVRLEGKVSCPWRAELNTKISRYPRDILYAQCACPRCSAPTHNRFLQDHTAHCHPVLYDIHVLVRTGQCGSNNKYIYEARVESIPVSCACIRPRLVSGLN